MSDTQTSAPVPALPSATIMLVRDGAAGLEVFMVARSRPVDGAQGAVVFPGGKVDADDEAPAWGQLVAPVTAPPLGFWIAAIRETFEEAGLLIAAPAGRPGTIVDAATAARIVGAQRNDLLDRKTCFSEILGRETLVPGLASLVPFAHWQTPVGLPKRFDTHFFLVATPPGQQPHLDGREMIDGFWCPPAAIVADGASGKRMLVPATRLNLELLAQSATVGDAIAAARSRRIVTVLPQRVVAADGPRMEIPPEAG